MEIRTFLLIDDDNALNFLNQHFLERNNPGCQVATACDGQEALDYLATLTKCPDVIFLDINMPGMDGFEFLEDYGKLLRCKENSKIFMLTSSMREEDKVTALDNKYVHGYFDKPLTENHMQRVITVLKGQ